jgi:hypothetical protein
MLSRLTRTAFCGVAVAALLVLVAAGCGGGKKSTSTTTSTTSSTSSVGAMGPRPAETRATIRQNWGTFFDGSTPTAQRVALLQNGDQFTSTIASIGGSSLARSASAQVTSVRLTGPDTATVTFTILLGGTPVVAGLKGQAVLVDGTWKVGIASLCQLASLEGLKPQGCQSAAK